MSKMKVGLQVYSIRDVAEKDFEGAMKAVKEMGYDGVELAGMYGIPATEIRQILDNVGLECISAHVSYGDLMSDIEGTVAAYNTVGAKFIALPYMNPEHRPTAPDFDKVLENIKKISDECKKYGIALLYHNHDFEFEKMPDGTYALDYLYKTAGLDVIKPEFDTCWVRVAGEDPVEYIKTYAGNCPVVHLKDFVGSKSENMYALIGIDKEASVTEEFRFRPVGYGVQDFPSIIKASVECGAGWVIVELENSYETPVLETATMSRDYIKSIYR